MTEISLKLPISAVILAKNEEENIKNCILTLGFCSEIIVVNDGSDDSTVRIAEKLGAKVYSREMNSDFSAQSNFGMEKSTMDWILFLDADERISPELQKEIYSKFINISGDIKAFRFKRIDYLWNKWLRHGEIGAFRSFRLVRRKSGKWQRRVHPSFSVNGLVYNLENPILHYPHKSLSKFLESINRWSTWHALANREEGKISGIGKIIFYPPAHFLKNYIFRLGFLDGMQGFVFALVMSGHSFLSWSKQWMLQKGFSKI